MPRKTPPCKAYPDWTEARYWSFIRSALRAAYRRWPPKFEVLREARRAKLGGGRQKFEYACAICHKYFPNKQVEVDHKIPAGSLRSYRDISGFVRRLFCSKDGLQVVCKECHKRKTKDESSNRTT